MSTDLEDMVLLSTVSEKSVVSNLDKRFKKDHIYTSIGPVLIVCNPFKWLKIYDPDTISKYEQGSAAGEDLPPHIFSVAENAFRTMLYEEEKQCVIISGESGAGKTEAAKQIMSYVAAVSGSGGNDAAVTQIKSVILESNPALESFGNAMTLRNNNSSRFGKYFEIQFDLSNGGTPTGGYITNYLLEKSRIVKPGSGERGFHIFYQILSAANKSRKDLKSQFYLKTWKDYNVLKCTGIGEINNEGGRVDDDAAFQETLESLTAIGISGQELTNFLRVAALCLHLSNLEFKESRINGADGSTLQDFGVVEILAKLMEINDPNSIVHAMTYRTLTTTGPGGTTETYEVPNNPTQANAARDALAKSLYSRLFDVLVSSVNTCLKNCGGKTKTALYKSSRAAHNDDEENFDPFGLSIGVLDIYGFEIFSVNLFEQFCINYVNEKLQQVFINLTIKSEQEDYASEGIEWKAIPFFDNQIVCDLVEGKRPPGILPILDDTCKTLSKMSNVDDKFLEKIGSFQRTNKHLDLTRPGVFTVVHYAGEVTYTVTGFIESNKDVLVKDLTLLAKSSGNSFIQNLYPEDVDFSNKRAPTTAGFKIRKQCSNLVDTLLAANPHYVRCIKSNSHKKPKVFENELVKHQVRYLGLLENIKVRRAGFAFRVEFFKFASRFRAFGNGEINHVLATGTDKDIAQALLKKAMAYVPALSQTGEAQLGKRKIFIKHPETVFELQKARKQLLNKQAVKIQNAWRRYRSRRELSNLRVEMENLWQKNQKEATPLDLVRPFNAFYIKDTSMNDSISSLLEFVGTREQLKFTDQVLKLNKRSEWDRIYFFVTNLAFYYGIQDHAGFYLKQRVELKHIEELLLSMESDDLFGIKLQPQHLLESPDQSNFVDKKSVKRCMETQTKFSFFGRHKHRCYYTGGIYIRESVSTKIPIPSRGYYTPVHVHKSVVGKVSVEMREDLVFKSEKKAEIVGILRDLASRAKGEKVAPVESRTAQVSTSIPVTTPKPMCKALYTYSPQQNDELGFNSGDIIEIIDSSETDWWTGKLNGRKGLIPANYVENLPQPADAPVPVVTVLPTETARAYRVGVNFCNTWTIRQALFQKLSNTCVGSIIFNRMTGIRDVASGIEGGNFVVHAPPGVAAEVIKRIRVNQKNRRAKREAARLEQEELRKQNAKQREAVRQADRRRRLEEKKAKRRELQEKKNTNNSRPPWTKPVLKNSTNKPQLNGMYQTNTSIPKNIPNKTPNGEKKNNRPAIPKNRPKIPTHRPKISSKPVEITGNMSYEEVLKLKADAATSNNIERNRLEEYLSDAHFEKVFGMPRADFNKLKKWRQVQKKKDAKLF